ncbi:hypothetical protein [Brochothrix thermosphacta]|uniref:Uncharacterized protein n=1 Tax=Brochothrix thermosphacta TaxID=2756 RepID=A0A2X0QJ88_BROTH|nr:hypothetical protein [Brochothrix thermosphacta]SPP28636.1 conserved hypothetical protein [Brochothrix thermosphacta]
MHEIAGYTFTEISALIAITTGAFSFVIYLFKKLVMDRLSWDLQDFRRSVDDLSHTLKDNTKRIDKAESLLDRHDERITNLQKEVFKR